MENKKARNRENYSAERRFCFISESLSFNHSRLIIVEIQDLVVFGEIESPLNKQSTKQSRKK